MVLSGSKALTKLTLADSLSVLYRSVSLCCTLCFIVGVSTPPLAKKEGSAEKSIKKVYLAIREIPCDVPMEDLVSSSGFPPIILEECSKH